ncbi:TetR/AcrR family transcriptional regulator [Paenarthrobacter aurescens]|jgi:TetR/AcrR family transcriptional repressor of lmrAB and yxaGH operons|nr:TetR/AcrR family transcriptional regulator [Paenarthrobacter aurescens]
MDLKTDKQPSLRERNRLRTRSDILDAAAEMLGESGYAGLALEEVSQRAGLSRGTVYAHFPGGRDDVVREVYLRVADAVYVRGISLREEALHPAGRISALARALVETTSSASGRFYGLMGPDVVPILSGVRRTSESFEALIKLDLSTARAEGQLHEGPDIDALSTALSGAIRASGARAAMNPETAEQQIAAVELLAAGLLCKPVQG